LRGVRRLPLVLRSLAGAVDGSGLAQCQDTEGHGGHGRNRDCAAPAVKADHLLLLSSRGLMPACPAGVRRLRLRPAHIPWIRVGQIVVAREIGARQPRDNPAAR
jgi:hypothetical protein